MQYGETQIDQFESFDGTKLPIHIWSPEKPKLILIGIHGGLAHAGDFQNIGRHFMKKNVATISYTLRGHLQKRAYIKKFELYDDDTFEFIQWVKQKYPSLPIVVFAHSMGALIINRVAIELIPADEQIKGYIFSSPYYENALKINRVALFFAGILSAIAPKMKAPAESLTDYTTRDEQILKQYKEDEKNNIRCTEASMRFANEILKRFKWVEKNISRFPVLNLYLISGSDKIADASIAIERTKLINQNLVTVQVIEDNYHEGYNDIDREDFFQRMTNWIDTVLNINLSEMNES